MIFLLFGVNVDPIWWANEAGKESMIVIGSIRSQRLLRTPPSSPSPAMATSNN